MCNLLSDLLLFGVCSKMVLDLRSRNWGNHLLMIACFPFLIFWLNDMACSASSKKFAFECIPQERLSSLCLAKKKKTLFLSSNFYPDGGYNLSDY